MVNISKVSRSDTRQAEVIERFFRTVNEMFLCDLRISPISLGQSGSLRPLRRIAELTACVTKLHEAVIPDRLHKGRITRIGLCYGAPGIGKTLSALRYSRAEMILKAHREPAESRDQLPIDTVLYTTEIVNTPARVQFEIRTTRERLKEVALRPIHQEATDTLDAIRLRDQARRAEILNKPDCSPCHRPAVDPTYFQTFERFQALKRTVPDPTTLILVDEADRLHMNSLEAIRSIFDDGRIGMVLIGMPGIERGSLASLSSIRGSASSMSSVS
jgi:hypothetical protein